MLRFSGQVNPSERFAESVEFDMTSKEEYSNVQ